MNDFDLESKLKDVPVPERPDAYWNDFPLRVRGQLRRMRDEFTPANPRQRRLAWAGACALAVALVFTGVRFHPLQTASFAISNQQRHFHAEWAQLDAGLHALVQDQHGMSYLVAERN